MVVFVIVNFYCVQVQATWFVLFAGNVALIDEIRENVDAKFEQRRDVVRIERFNKTDLIFVMYLSWDPGQN